MGKIIITGAVCALLIVLVVFSFIQIKEDIIQEEEEFVVYQIEEKLEPHIIDVEERMLSGWGVIQDADWFFPLSEDIMGEYTLEWDYRPEYGGFDLYLYIEKEICQPKGIELGFYNDSSKSSIRVWTREWNSEGGTTDVYRLTCDFRVERRHESYTEVIQKEIFLGNIFFETPSPTYNLTFDKEEEWFVLYDRYYDYTLEIEWTSKEPTKITEWVEVEVLDCKCVAKCEIGSGGWGTCSYQNKKASDLTREWLDETCDPDTPGDGWKCEDYLVEVKE